MKRTAVLSRQAGTSMLTYIVVVSLIALGVMPYAVAFGRRVVRRYAAADASMDQGTPLHRVPVKIEPHKDGWRILDHSPNRNERDWWSGDTDPSRDPNGPRYDSQSTGYANVEETLYGGHHLGNMTGEWDPEGLLNRFTQWDAKSCQNVRCAPTCAVAAAAMGGPEALRRLVERFRESLIHGRTSENPAERLSPQAAEATLDDLLGRIENGTVTREDMGVVDELMARYYQQDPILGASKQAATEMMALGAKSSRPADSLPANASELRSFVQDKLKPGEVVRSAVDTDGDTDSSQGNHHAVLIGKDASGREYLYDPLPKQAGTPQIVYRDSNPQQYDYYLENMVRYHDVSGSQAGHLVGGRVFQY